MRATHETLIDGFIIVCSLGIGVLIASLPETAIDDFLGLDSYGLYMYIKRTFQEHATNGSKELLQASIVGQVKRFGIELIRITGICLPFLTIGVAIAIVRHPSTRTRKSRQRIGILTAFTSCTLVMGKMIGVVTLRIAEPTPQAIFFMPPPVGTMLGDSSADIGVGITALWVLFAISNRWQTASSCGDRLGRGLGVIYVAYAFLTFLRVASGIM